MPTLDITDGHRDRIESLREALAAAHAGPYASVDTEDALAYLLDLADAVDDPELAADPAVLAPDPVEPADAEADGAAAAAGADAVPAFDRDAARERLGARNRRHGDPDDADEMDLYAIAAAFDVSGRSDMTKAELIDAILDAAEALADDPFSLVDVDLAAASEIDADGDDTEKGDSDDTEKGESDDTEKGDSDDTEKGESDDTEESDDAGSSQLDAMMSLLDTHDDKWREGEGDARYEVVLPDGDVETARTKDDVRALLFKNY
ncbi:Rho termination factor N-terminal domain-containing protein [Halorubrum sp. DTA46]|uniref:Rho termination factor N-terminal domain-containing protein n=1 Tax=Halorubrum sp. DTA46 TaxID=3402162 RepID=UPI003AAEDC94